MMITILEVEIIYNDGGEITYSDVVKVERDDILRAMIIRDKFGNFSITPTDTMRLFEVRRTEERIHVDDIIK